MEKKLWTENTYTHQKIAKFVSLKLKRDHLHTYTGAITLVHHIKCVNTKQKQKKNEQ